MKAAEAANADLAARLAQQQEIDVEKTAQLAADQQMIEVSLLPHTALPAVTPAQVSRL